jgi:hypothetical protein
MDSLDRSLLERVARTIWLQERRASTAEPVGADWGVAHRVAGLSASNWRINRLRCVAALRRAK